MGHIWANLYSIITSPLNLVCTHAFNRSALSLPASLGFCFFFSATLPLFFILHIIEFYVGFDKKFLLWDGKKYRLSPFNLSAIVDLLNGVGAHMLLLIGALSLSVRILGFSLELDPLCFFPGEEKISGTSLPHFLDMAQRRWLPTNNNSRETAPHPHRPTHQAAIRLLNLK